MPKKQLNKGTPISLYMGDKRTAEKYRAVFQKFAKADRRSVSDFIWTVIEDGPSKELKEALRAAKSQ